MATENDENVFASPWNDSDMVLVVEDHELHVHKSILTLQSPVFKAMFDGRFQEASQDKITLKRKDPQSMIRFLKLLYPSSMFPESKAPLEDKNRLSVLALADEYQCESLIKQCIDEAKITTKNVLKILPYALNYHHTALERMLKVIKHVPTRKLEEFLPEVESKETTSSILLAKCHSLESRVVKMHDTIICLLRDLLIHKQFGKEAQSELNRAWEQITILEEVKDLDEMSDYLENFPWCTAKYTQTRPKMPSEMETKANYLCPHTVEVGEIHKVKSCLSCKRKYRQQFISPIPACLKQRKFFKMLQRGDDIAHAVYPDRSSSDS